MRKNLERLAAFIFGLVFLAGCAPADPRQAEAEQAWAICNAGHNQRACRRVSLLLEQGFAAEALLETSRQDFIARYSIRARFPDSPRDVVAHVVLGEIVVCGEMRIPTGQWRRVLRRSNTDEDLIEGLSWNFDEDIWEAYCD